MFTEIHDRYSKLTLAGKAAAWALIIIIPGGILSALVGSGFWGEKAPQRAGYWAVDPEHPNRQWGPTGPRLSEKCDVTKDCNTSGCHLKSHCVGTPEQCTERY